MSQYPSYPPPPPGGQPPAPPRRGINWPAYVLGAIFGPPVLLGVGGTFAAMLGHLFGDGARSIGGVATVGLLVGVPIALCVPDRTRAWGVGIFIGFALWLVIGAGACVIMIAAFVHGENAG
jgi:hypothetical protein